MRPVREILTLPEPGLKCFSSVDMTFRPHWHNEPEMVAVTAGVVHVGMSRNVVQVRAGEVAVVRGGDIHHYRSDPGSACWTMIFRPDNLFDTTAVQRWEGVFRNIIPGDFGQITEGCREIADASQMKYSGYELLERGNMYRILGLLAKSGATEQPGHGGRAALSRLSQIRTAMEFIDSHVAEVLTLERIAAVAGYGNSHFSRVFSETVGMPLLAYIQQVRIERALEMMAETNDIALIAGTCGFESVRQFYRVFRTVTGETPVRKGKKLQRSDVYETHPDQP